jgi:hypothetical protein
LVFRPEDFGARGDGATNDTAAFGRMSKEVRRRGGGTIELRAGTTYVVGAQSLGNRGWQPEPILELSNLAGPITIRGNGARLLAHPGLRFGTFDRKSGKPSHHPMPYWDAADLAVPYSAMILIRDCAQTVTIRDVELDGNVEKLIVGGQYGDTGWQVPGSGLVLIGNSGPEIIEQVRSHRHPEDGAMLAASVRRVGRTEVTGLICKYNGRQGLSIVGGKAYDFADCEFSHSGRLKVLSAPAAGVDIEAESPPVYDLSFTRCRFVDNAGCGMLAGSGDSRDLRFTDCSFVGTTSWSAWPNKPRSSFLRCTFVGSVVHPYADKNPELAARFTSCTFTDDPRLSPTGKVYTDKGPIVNLGESDNVRFDQCAFKLVGAGILPWSWKAIYQDCTMSQTSKKVAFPKGRYRGHTTINGSVNLDGSMIEGTVIVNSRKLPLGAIAIAPW